MQFTFFNRLGNLEEHATIQNVTGGEFMMCIMTSLRPLIDDTKIKLFLFNLIQTLKMEGMTLAERELSNFMFEFIAANSIKGEMKWLFKDSKNLKSENPWKIERHLGTKLYTGDELLMIGEEEEKLFIERATGNSGTIKIQREDYKKESLNLDAREPKFYCPYQELLKNEIRSRIKDDEEIIFFESYLRDAQRSESKNWDNEKTYKGLKEENNWGEIMEPFEFRADVEEEKTTWNTEEERQQLVNDLDLGFSQRIYKPSPRDEENSSDEYSGNETSEEIGKTKFNWTFDLPKFENEIYREDSYEDDEKDIDLITALNLSKATEIEDNQRRIDIQTQDMQTFNETMIASRDIVGKVDKDESDDIVSSDNSYEEESELKYTMDLSFENDKDLKVNSKKYSIEDSDEYTSPSMEQEKNELEMNEESRAEYNKLKDIARQVRENLGSRTYEDVFNEFMGTDIGEKPEGTELIDKGKELDYSDLNVKPEFELKQSENNEKTKKEKPKKNSEPKKETERELTSDEELMGALKKMSENPKKDSDKIPFLEIIANEGRMNDVTREIIKLVMKIDEIIVETTKSNQDLWTRRSQFWINFSNGAITSYVVTNSAYSRVASDMIKLAALKKVQLSVDSKVMNKIEKPIFLLIGKLYTQAEIDKQFREFGIKSQLMSRTRPEELMLPPVYTAMADQKIKNLK
jgi:hypothetical protein